RVEGTDVSVGVAAGLGDMQGQGVLQIAELMLAFVLAAAIGLERRLRGKSAGLKTQTIVGVTRGAAGADQQIRVLRRARRRGDPRPLPRGCADPVRGG